MKSLSKLALCLLLAMSLTVSAFAAQVPDSLVAENLNGQQRLVKTYTLSPEVDPDELKEEDFSYDGYLYTWAYTTKVEHPYLESKTVTETVTVNTAKNDLAQILAELSPSMPYEKDGFSGELALDHTTLSTEASGYTTKYSKTTETKVIGNLDRNDMSYVPATTVKNGKTLTLANVEWQVTGTALVGEALVPAQYQAVATYSASSSYQAATGYVTTAEYHGTVTSEGVDSITYTVVYTGSEIVPVKTHIWDNGSLAAPLLIIAAVLLCAGIAAAALILLCRRKNVYWQLDPTVHDVTLEYPGQIIKLSAYDKPSSLGVSITKRGNAQVMAGQSMRYDLTVANTSNVPLESFFWHDKIPYDVARPTTLTTGTYSARLNYRVLYKTNYNASYQVLASNLLTSNNYSFSLNAIPMQAGEVVTDIYFDFGKVPVGFQSTVNPTLSVMVNGNAVNGYQMVNRADVGGKYQGTWQTATASWVTIIRRLWNTPTLPKTGY